MHDPRVLLDPATDAARRLARRGHVLDVAALDDLLSRRNKSIRMADELRAESRKVAAEVGRTAKAGGDATPLKERARGLKDEIRDVEAEQETLTGQLRELMLTIPNLPHDDVPDGMTEDDAVEIRRWGTPPEFGFRVRDHVDLGEALGILDLGRATKLSGPRFSVTRGAGAALERGLALYFLDLHTRRHGYTEFSVPFLVTRDTMTGIGQLPKFEEDLFRTSTGSRDLYLIPTAEVPLTAMHADEIVDPGSLPLAYTSWTPCFRSEAGSYGRDTRGILRLHQFSKVELVRVCAAEESQAELETLVGHAEAVLQGLGLPHRVIRLAAGDMGFSSQMTYDIEVWLPGQGRFRELTSCSNTTDYQARRLECRMRTERGTRVLHTLNGTAVTSSRTMIAVLETHQRADGSVAVPTVLHPFGAPATIGPPPGLNEGP
jgi:seryl-tRNA synthetase